MVTTGNPTTPASYINLPTPGSKQAPQKFRGHHRDLNRFLEHYKHVCVQSHVTEDSQKCLGLPTYCSNRVADTIENLDSYVSQNFDELVVELQWIYDGDRRKAEYHTGYIADFTKAWRGEEIPNLETFKQYHREYIEVAGPLKVSGHIDAKDFNRGFWEGLNQDTRDRIERRMTDDEPSLDLAVPFPIIKVVKAAEHVFNRNRFDKHLRDGKRVSIRTPDNRSSTKRRHRRRKSYRSDSDSDSDSTEEETTPRWRRNKAPEKPRAPTPVPKPEAPRKKTEADEIADIVKELEALSIHDPPYRAFYIQLSLRAPKLLPYYAEPPTPRTRSYQAQETRFPPEDRSRRDPPPHQRTPQFEPRFGDRQGQVCYGCGGRGHRMDQCEKIEALINQGCVRRVAGRLRWTDGSNIMREPEEAYSEAIARRQQQDVVTRGTDEKTGGKSVYLMEVTRESSDADTDEQEGMGWRSGSTTIGHLQAYGVERVPRVSREVRKSGQPHVPARAHWMKQLPTTGHLDRANGKKDAVAKDANFDRRQNLPLRTSTSTPIDVSQTEFKGVLDSELVPMDTEDLVVDKRLQDKRKVSSRSPEGPAGDVGHTRPKKGRAQSEVVNGILNLPLTMSLQELACISPNVRRDLVGTLKAMRDDSMEDIGTGHVVATETKPSLKEKGKKAMKAEEAPQEVFLGNTSRYQPRSELLKVKMAIGDATMVGIVDTGSMVNMISAKKLDETGLPSERLKKDRELNVTGVNGVTSRCRTWVPGVTMNLTSRNKETYGDLYVLENADFELLLGRPWGSGNGVSIKERPHGTYLVWPTEVDTKNELGVSKARPVLRDLDNEADLCEIRLDAETDDEGDDPVTSLTVRVNESEGTDRSYIPLEEEGEAGPSNTGQQNPEEEEEKLEVIARRARRQIGEWTKVADSADKGEDADDEGGRDEEVEGPPPNQLGREKRKAREKKEKGKDSSQVPKKKRRTQRKDIIEIDQRMEAELTRLVQDQANEREWGMFCSKERQRTTRNDQQWVDWERGYEREEPVGNLASDSNEERDPPYMTPEPEPGTRENPLWSHTLETPPETEVKVASPRPEAKRTPHATTETTIRRSQRIRRTTACALCGEEPKVVSRTYQRNEKVSRTVSKRTRRAPEPGTPQEPDEGPKVFSFCLRVRPESPDDMELGMRKDQPAQKRKSGWRPRGRSGETRQPPTIATPLPSHQPSRPYDAPYGTIPEYLPGRTQAIMRKPVLRPLKIPVYPQSRGSRGPVVPPRASTPDSGSNDDSDGLSIIEPIVEMVSSWEAEIQEAPAVRTYTRGLRTRPDSEIDPYRMRTQDPNIEGRNGSRREDYRPRNNLNGRSKRERPGTPPRRGTNRYEGAGRKMSYVIPTLAPQSDRFALPDGVAFDLGQYVIRQGESLDRGNDSQTPQHGLKSRAGCRDLRRTSFEWAERERGRRPQYSRMVTRPEREPLERNEDRPVDIEADIFQRATAGSSRTLGARGQSRTTLRALGARVTEDNDEEGEGKGIKRRGESKTNPHLPSWLPKPPKSTKLLPRIRSSPRSLYLTLLVLTVSLVLALLPPTIRLRMTNLKLLTGLDNHPEEPRQGHSSSESRLDPFRCASIDHQEVNPGTWTTSPDRSTIIDVPKTGLATIPIVPDAYMIRGILGISHLVPLVGGSSLPTHEFLAKAITGSFRYPSGRVVRVRGDAHIRIFEKDMTTEWRDVELPSRTEVDRLRGVLFREEGYGDLMVKIRAELKGKQSFLPEPRDFYDQKRISTALEEAKGRAPPPNSPVGTIKIGPPTRKPGEVRPVIRSADTNFGASGMAPQPPKDDASDVPGVPLEKGKNPEREEGEFVIKEEEDQDVPSKHGPPSKTTTAVSYASVVGSYRPLLTPPTEGSTQPSTPPDLGYPEEGQEEGSLDFVHVPNEAPTHPQGNPLSSAPIATSEQKPGTHADEALVDIIEVLRMLRSEFGEALNHEIRKLISDVEMEAARVLELRERRQKQSEKKDKDGDVEMEREERTSQTIPDPPDQVSSSRSVPPEATALTPFQQNIRRMEGELQSLQWKKVDKENRLGERLAALEARVIAVEARSGEGGDPWTTVMPARRRPAPQARNPSDRPVSYAVIQRIEGKVDSVLRDVYAIRTRVGSMEKSVEGGDVVRKRVNGLDMHVASVLGEVMASNKKVAGLEGKWEEERLRQSITTRETSPMTGVLPRLTKLESRMLDAEYRAATAEEQMVWTDAKLRAVWATIVAPSTTDAHAQALRVKMVWNGAAEAFNRRASNAPFSIPVPRIVTDIAVKNPFDANNGKATTGTFNLPTIRSNDDNIPGTSNKPPSQY